MEAPEPETLVERSDELDRKLMVITFRRHVAIYVLVAFILALSVGQFVVLVRLGGDNHRVLLSQIPGLQAQIRDRDRTIQVREQTISDQKFELGEAVDAIVKLAAQVKRLGGDPGQIEIKPPHHGGGH